MNRPSSGNRPPVGSMNRPPRPGNMSRVYVNPRPGARPAPRSVHGEFRGAPARFSHVGHHGYGRYIPAPPPHYELRRFHGIDYYFWDDVWYRFHSGRYWVCRPPFGYVFTPLADAVFAACSFAYYYDTINENARIIAEQNQAITAGNAAIAEQNAALAASAQRAQVSGSLASSLGLSQSFASAGTEYFYNDGVFYVKDADGQYTVIVPPAGALVDSLPDDYEIIELGGNTYYKVDDTVYRMTVSADGKACFEVLGQLAA